ncbi:beta-lactamase [Lysobacter enzymogenes]|uniref:Beta-lactamase n=1 Tax=Lysobacter enzymogenes TaxID=69 RepID=A0A0S2DAH4_LYSEN|nr:beta-lactamase [Lysobacter enzymogenes]
MGGISTLVGGTSVPTLSDPVAKHPDASPFDPLHAWMTQATRPGGYLGAVTLIVHEGRIVDFRSYGHRDLARRAPMRRDTIFRIYSMSKTVTSAAVMQLAERGLIDVEAPVQRYLPELADRQVASGDAQAPTLRPARRAITVRHLLTHTAGFAAGLPGDDAATALTRRHDPHAARDLAGFVARLARAPLAADPGTRFGYDGAATEVLARLVEAVSGQRFEAYLREHLFAPLRMRDTGFAVPAAARGRIADLTTTGDDGRLRLDDGPSQREPGAPLNAYASGAGGLYSTACDYARFAQMLLDGGRIADESGFAECDSSRRDGAGPRVLRADTVAAMLRNQLTMLDPPVHQYDAGEGFGYGGAVVIDPARRSVPASLGQFGWPGAASTTYAIDPKRRTVALALLQHLPRAGVAGDPPRLSKDFYRLAFAATDAAGRAAARSP